MLPSRRLAILVVAGAIPALFAGTARAGLTVALIYNGLLAAVALLDFVITERPAVFNLNREYEYKMSLGAENPVKITVVNRGRHRYRVIVKDEPPPANFITAGYRFESALAPGEERSFLYKLVPRKRGDYSFGTINFRYYSRLGLFIRQVQADAAGREMKVYPNIADVRRHSLKVQQGCLRETGIRPALVRGLGTDFEGLRDYVPDDEYRRVNWTASARRGKLVVNEYQDEKSQNILLVLDSGRMMTAGADRLSKFDTAVNAALLLGYVGVTRDDKVGLAVFDSRVRLFLPPKKGKGQLQRITASLYNIEPEVVEPDYHGACHYLLEKNRKRSLICIFTDLVDSEASRQLVNYVSVLAHRHLVVCITLIDSEVVKTARCLPDSSQELYEKAVAEGVLRQREKAIATLRNMGVAVVNVPPEELSVAVINKYLEFKARGRI